MLGGTRGRVCPLPRFKIALRKLECAEGKGHIRCSFERSMKIFFVEMLGSFTKGISLVLYLKFQLWDFIFFHLTDKKSDIYFSLKIRGKSLTFRTSIICTGAKTKGSNVEEEEGQKCWNLTSIRDDNKNKRKQKCTSRASFRLLRLKPSISGMFKSYFSFC